MPGTRRIAVAIAASGLCVAALSATAPAAQIRGGTIEGSQHKLKQFDRTSPRNAGGTLRCPDGKGALTGGAFWHQTGVGPDPAVSNLVVLTSSFPTLNGRGWYADGQSNSIDPRTLTVEIRCLPQGQLDRVKTEHERKVLDSGTAATVKARCPEGFLVMTGGSFLSRPGEDPKPKTSARGRITGSLPISNQTKWQAIGGNFSEGKLALHAVARCIPDSKLGPTNAYFPTVLVSDQGTGGGYGSCVGDTRALTGGVSWRVQGQQKPSVDLATSTYVSGNALTFDVLGYYAAGLNLSGQQLHLDTAIICPQL